MLVIISCLRSEISLVVLCIQNYWEGKLRFGLVFNGECLPVAGDFLCIYLRSNLRSNECWTKISI